MKVFFCRLICAIFIVRQGATGFDRLLQTNEPDSSSVDYETTWAEETTSTIGITSTDESSSGPSSSTEWIPPTDQCGIANSLPTTPQSKITGGEETQPNEFPWIVYLNNTSFDCVGSLISDQWILTSASCLYNQNRIEVYLGVHQLDNPNEDNRIKFISSEFYFHPSYNSYYKRYDIGLIKLPSPVSVTRNIRPICLPRTNDPDHVNDNVVLIGWANVTSNPTTTTIPMTSSISEVTTNYYPTNTNYPKTTDLVSFFANGLILTDNLASFPNEGATSNPYLPSDNLTTTNSLHSINATVISRNECQKSHGYVITDSVICSISENPGSGLCQADFGGPMNYKQSNGIWIQIGVASFRSGPLSVPNITCESNTPSGFTRISSFLSWIYFITKLPDPDNPMTSITTSSSHSESSTTNNPSTVSTSKPTTVYNTPTTSDPLGNRATRLRITFLPVTGEYFQSFVLVMRSFLLLFLNNKILAAVTKTI